MRLFTRSVSRRLISGFGLLLLLICVLGAITVSELSRMGSRMDSIVDVNNYRTSLARDMLDGLNKMSIQARTIAIMTDMPGIDSELKKLSTSVDEYKLAQESLKKSLATERETSPERILFDDIVMLGQQAIPLILEAAQSGADGDAVAAAMALNTRTLPVEVKWRAQVNEFVLAQSKSTESAVADARAARNAAFTWAASLVIFAVVVGAIVMWRITHSIKMPIEQTLAIAEKIAAGDLTTAVTSDRQDELGRLLTAVGAMQDRLRMLVTEIQNAADSISTASAEVAAGNLDLSNRTDMASTNLEHTASSMKNLTTTVQQGASAAKQANQLAEEARAVALRGGDAVSKVVDTMEKINASSTKIADITGVINNIAFQTNILALNAAIEAARAGEHGRGFSVVAGEVRSLAARSAEAAREINALISSSVEEIETGSSVVGAAGDTMSDIVTTVQRVSDIVNEITAAATEQSAGITQINSSVVQLDQMTQQNAALVEEGTAAAESLRDQAEHLTRLLSSFKV